MKWVLVFVALSHHGHPIATEEGRYETMEKCFDAREKLVLEQGKPVANEYQAVCVSHKIVDKY
ncbi:MAG: hypothetical protein VW551_07905 [Euryarchaeota archaeon]|jgi:hypothetical protein